MTVQWIPNVYSGDTQLEGHKPLYLQSACNYMKKVDLQKKYALEMLINYPSKKFFDIFYLKLTARTLYHNSTRLS